MTTVALFGYGFTGYGALRALQHLAMAEGWRHKFVATHTPEEEEVRPPRLNEVYIDSDATVVAAPRRENPRNFYDLLPYVDVLLCAGYRRILPPELLQKGVHCLNIHSGKLPKYAGRRPVQRAIEDGDLPVICTLHEMVEEVDAGRPVTELRVPGRDLHEIYHNLYNAAFDIVKNLPRALR